ncbi:MepB family protein [Rhodococcus oryzae]|uniref:MepB family protein n=1 Tax=Rhodococcus oryzae TaxID=2571143 RepID=UPI00371AD903
MSIEREPWPDTGAVPADLLAAKTLVFDPCGIACSAPVPEPESAAYGAHEFTADGRPIRFRVAKTTPNKVGQFVTLWKRSAQGPIAPFDIVDPVELVIVSTRDGDRLGQFVFPRRALAERGVLSRDGVGGKRAIRVYPPWAAPTSRQARGTQAWQLDHFLPIADAGALDTARALALYRA